MGKGTGIQWADSTVNPTSGCDGCELWTPNVGGPCYAGNFHQNRLAKSLPLLYDPNFSNVRMISGRVQKIARCMDLTGKTTPDRLNKPWLAGKRCKIFVGDLGDIFSKAVTFDFLKEEIFDVATSPNGLRHDLLLLTKQPQRAVQFAAWLRCRGMEWPDNVWLGTSITNQASMPRITHLLQVPAKIRYLSIEPLCSAIVLPDLTGINWMIVGGESDQGEHEARAFDMAWARNVITLGKAKNIAVFVKQLGSHVIENNKRVTLHDTHGGEPHEWPDDLRIRQMPFNSN